MPQPITHLVSLIALLTIPFLSNKSLETSNACPKIIIECNSGKSCCFSPFEFSARIEDIKPTDKPTYKWGEDYQGYSVVNLTKGTYQVYFPEEGYKGFGFCWTAVFPSPDKLMLAVDGCIWAYPYEIVFYDFSEPDNLPYKELGRVSDITDSEGWLDNETFVLSREVEIRKSDGVPYEQLSQEEQEILDADHSLTDYRVEKVNAKRPFLDSAV
jgi:hypothetical protein